MSSETNLPPSYKKTEIGIIPEDWEVKRLEDIVEDNGFVRGPFGGSLKKEFFTKKGYKVYTQQNAIYRSVELGNYYIDEKKFQELKRFEIKENDFIVSCSGTIGKIFKIPRKHKKGIINQALLIIRINTKLIDENFFYQYFTWEKFQEAIIDKTQGGAMHNLVEINEFKKTNIIYPPLPEQRAIARILSDFDALIESLDQLIEKKKAVKKGAMQELLTGKKRLSGFTGDWVRKNLLNLAWFQEGPGVTNDLFAKRGIKLLNVGNLDDNKLNLSKTNTYISRFLAYSAYKKFLLDENDIVIGSSGVTAENFSSKVAIVNKKHLPLCLNTSTIRFKTNTATVDHKFFYYLLQSMQFIRQIFIQATGSAQLNFGPYHLKKVSFCLPSLIEEQQAIAQVFSDMDAEIEALERKKKKYEMMKKGAMELLLTGKVRLKNINFENGGNTYETKGSNDS